jgi:transcriptional regulator with XRE-family HTH domain
MPLSGIAERAGVTPSFLSQLERGLATPSVATLLRLADVFDVSIGDLFPPSSSSRVVQATERRTVRFSGLTEGLLTPPDAQMLGAAICTFAPHGDSGQMAHRSLEELLFVLQGALEVVFDHEIVAISEGGALTYDCRMPHILRNPTPHETVALMCHAPRANSTEASLSGATVLGHRSIEEESAPIRTLR